MRPRLERPGSSPSAAPCSGCRRAAAALRAGSAAPRRGSGPGPACPAPRCGRAASACRRTRRTAACCAAASQHRVLQAGVAQLAHAVAHRALAGQHHALGGAHLVGPRGDDHLDSRCRRPRAAPPATPSAGCPCRSRRRRRCVMRRLPAQRLAASATGCPWSTGSRRPQRGSSASAMRSARAKALNTVSHWWCALSPLQVVDVQRDQRVVGEALEELVGELGVEAADHAGLERHVACAARGGRRSRSPRATAPRPAARRRGRSGVMPRLVAHRLRHRHARA